MSCFFYFLIRLGHNFTWTPNQLQHPVFEYHRTSSSCDTHTYNKKHLKLYNVSILVDWYDRQILNHNLYFVFSPYLEWVLCNEWSLSQDHSLTLSSSIYFCLWNQAFRSLSTYIPILLHIFICNVLNFIKFAGYFKHKCNKPK